MPLDPSWRPRELEVDMQPTWLRIEHRPSKALVLDGELFAKVKHDGAAAHGPIAAQMSLCIVILFSGVVGVLFRLNMGARQRSTDGDTGEGGQQGQVHVEEGTVAMCHQGAPFDRHHD